MRTTLCILIIITALLSAILYVKLRPASLQVIPLEPLETAVEYCLGVTTSKTLSDYEQCIFTIVLPEGITPDKIAGVKIDCTSVNMASVTIGDVTVTSTGTTCEAQVTLSFSGLSYVIQSTLYALPDTSAIDCSTKMSSSRTRLLSCLLVIIFDKDPVSIIVRTSDPSVTCMCREVKREVNQVYALGSVNVPLGGSRITLNCTCIVPIDLQEFSLVITDERPNAEAVFTFSFSSS